LRANADTTSLAGRIVPFADASVTAGVLSAFALKRRRPTYKLRIGHIHGRLNGADS
jgi:hypothetical protein